MGLPSGTDDLAQVLPLHVLHGEKVRAVFLADVVDLNDVGMVKRRCEASFREKHLDEFVAFGVLGQNPLEHDELLEAMHRARARKEQLRHATRG
jgi:hypothetical protein